MLHQFERPHVLMASLGTLAALVCPPAAAQNDDDARRLGVITVTAEKTEESVQDVSLSVQAFDSDALEKSGVNDVSRLEYLVPGVSFAFTGNDAKFNVRGANSSNTYSDNSSIVGTFIDGVYKTRASQQTRAFFDIERVEFLKGPQGTLYGRNTLAGALNVRSNTVDLNGYSARLDASYQSYDRSKFEGVINVPLSQELGVRVAGFVDKSDGYIANNAGGNLGAQDDKGIRITAVWLATPNIDVTLRYSHIEEDGREAGLFGYTFISRRLNSQGLTDPFGNTVDPFNPSNGSASPGSRQGNPNANDIGPYTISQDFTPNADLDEDVYIAEVNWDAGPVTARAIGSYTSYRNYIGFDADFSPNPFLLSGFDETVSALTAELVLASDNESELQWTAGGYFSDEDVYFNYSDFTQTVEDNNRLPGRLTGTPIASRDTMLAASYADALWIDQRVYGAFAQAEYSLTPIIRLIAGARFSREEKSSAGGSNFTGDTNEDGRVDPVVSFNLAGESLTPLAVPRQSRSVYTFNRNSPDANLAERTYDNITWRVGAEYDFGDRSMAYVSAGTGFLSGALNVGGNTTDEQNSTFGEIGVKSQLLNDTLKFNLAAHYTQYRNLLAQIQVATDSGTVRTESRNGGEINAWGLEIDSAWIPVDGLTVNLNLAYTNSTFGTFGQQSPYQAFSGSQPQLTPGTIDVMGERTAFTPQWSGSLGASYEYDLGRYGTVTPVVLFFYSSDFNTSNQLAIDPLQRQDAYTKTDLRLIWDSPERTFTAEIFVENLENTAVLARGTSNGDDIVQTSYLYPRNLGARLSARF